MQPSARSSPLFVIFSVVAFVLLLLWSSQPTNAFVFFGSLMRSDTLVSYSVQGHHRWRPDSCVSCPSHRRRRSRRQDKGRWMRMDDEIARDGIKTELTTRDEYLATRFTKLSTSGHDLTPFTQQELQEAALSLPKNARAVLFGDGTWQDSCTGRFRDHREKGLYACVVGGLPLFTSGWKLEPRAEDICPSFAEPCDEEHLVERKDDESGLTNIFCPRSRLRVGLVLDDATSPTGKRYLVTSEALEFHPLGKPLPVRCQPENYWGSEGQYRAWQFLE